MSLGYQQGWETQEREIVVDALPVRGTFPAWLSGTLLRNGPGRFEVGAQRLRHWFDGLAMLHRFGFHDGNVSYANRFLHSPHYRYVQQHGRLGYSEFATDPCRSIFRRIATMFSPEPPEMGINASVSISKLADRFVAWTETPVPIEFDPDTLATIGPFPFADALDSATSTPHPHLDPCSGDAINSSLMFGRVSAYKLFRIPRHDGPREVIAALEVAEPAYMHSFSLTPNYIVLAEYPLVVNPLRLLTSGKPFAENLRWKAERTTNFLVIRKDDGTLVGRYEAAPFFCFHHINAFERDGAVIVDLMAYPDGSVINKMYLDHLRRAAPNEAPVPGAQPRRYTIDLQRGHVAYETLSDERFELPRINYERSHTQPYRYIYATGVRKDRPVDFTNQLVKLDIDTKRATLWYADDCYPGEPVFVAAPDAEREDDGLILSVVLHARRGTSFLLALDARTFAEVARADVPQRIPFGFHGAFYES